MGLQSVLRTKNELRIILPQSEGEGASLSSRSSADDMVPIDGVRGSLLKSPTKQPRMDNLSHSVAFLLLH